MDFVDYKGVPDTWQFRNGQPQISPEFLTNVLNGETIWTVRSNNGQDPRNRFHLGLSLDPVKHVEFDANLYFTGPFWEGAILGHHRLDLRLAWKPVDELEISMVGEDMLRYSHQKNTNNSIAYASLIQQRYDLQSTCWWYK